MKAGAIKIWLFVLGIVAAILAVCLMQIHNVNPLHFN
jgi:hypothetical protein